VAEAQAVRPAQHWYLVEATLVVLVAICQTERQEVQEMDLMVDMEEAAGVGALKTMLLLMALAMEDEVVQDWQ
jgi:hypothetical protein